MRRFVRLTTVLLVVCLLAFALPGCKTGKETVRLYEVTHSVFYAPQYAAIHLGYFEAEGLSIELTNAGGADKAMTALLAGQADLAFCGPEAAVYVYNEGRSDYAAIIGQVTKRDGSFLLGRQAEPNFTWEGLKGKHVLAGRKGGIPYMTLEHVVKSHGLTPNVDVNMDTGVQYNLMGGAFAGGTGDYVTLFEPGATELQNQGNAFIVASVGEESGEVPYTAYMALTSQLKKNPALYERFLRALYKGQQWVLGHSAEEIAKAIAPSFEGSDLKVLTAVAQRYLDIDAWTDTPVMKKDAFERLQDIMQEAGELNTRAPYSPLVDNTLAEKVTKK